MKEINLHNKVLSVDLSLLLKVSEDMIRRDLKELADNDRIIKVHGGAISKSMVRPFIADNNIYALEEKKIIASKALTLIQDNMTLLFEGGTTILELANQLPPKKNLPSLPSVHKWPLPCPIMRTSMYIQSVEN